MRLLIIGIENCPLEINPFTAKHSLNKTFSYLVKYVRYYNYLEHLDYLVANLATIVARSSERVKQR